MGRAVTLFLGLALFAGTAPAVPFTLGATIRAGDVNTGHTATLGSSSASPSAYGVIYPYWLPAGINHNFQLAFDGATGTLSLNIDWLSLNALSLSWVVPGGGGNLARTWTVSPGGLSVTAEANPAVDSSIRVRTLSFTGPGFVGVGTPQLLASQTGTTVTASNAAPVTFTTADGAGSWLLDGQIRFTGLGFYNAGGAVNDELRFAFDILSTEVPEPSTLLIGALGLAALGVLHHVRSRRLAKLKPRNGPKQP